MKEMKCLDCDKTFRAGSSEEMLNNMMPHYMEDHAEMMKSGNEEDKKIWFERFNKGWDDAQEIDL